MAHQVASISKEVLRRFPMNHIKYAFCYGSGAFQQTGSKMASNVLDYILVVDSNHHFHSDNMKLNKSDYSFLKYFGVDALTKVHGTGVYFNTLVPFDSRTIKYGVVSSTDFQADLLDWTTLYLSGRLHKPVHIIYDSGDRPITSAIKNNLESAIHASLLLLPDTFSELQLFITVAGLSYSGDMRMGVAEDGNKITNIVTPNLHHFRSLYENILEHEEHLLWDKNSGKLEQIPNFATRFHHLNLLPFGVQERLVSHRNTDGRYRDIEEVIRQVATDEVNCERLVRKSVTDIVKQSSLEQTVKSALAAGVRKSLVYGMAKVRKSFKSKLKS